VRRKKEEEKIIFSTRTKIKQHSTARQHGRERDFLKRFQSNGEKIRFHALSNPLKVITS
jgi:hypothetical protein